MKTSAKLILLFIILTLVSCNKETIEVYPKKQDDHKHLGKGVWVQIEESFTKADDFDGYRGPASSSSVSVKIEHTSSKEVRQRYHSLVLKKDQNVLVEFTEVKYAGRDSAFFVTIKDKRLKMYKHLLSIKDGDKVINVNAFCYTKQGGYYNPVLKKSLLSTVIDTKTKVRQETFVFAEKDWLLTTTFTKDGLNPTESPDQAIYKSGIYKSVRNSQDVKNIQELVYDISGEKNVKVIKEELLNGYYQYATSSGNGRHVFSALIYGDNREGYYIICHGNAEVNITDCQKHFMKTRIIDE